MASPRAAAGLVQIPPATANRGSASTCSASRVLGRFAAMASAAAWLQVPYCYCIAFAIVVDGFRGPPMAPMNLAGVLPWIHWRGLVILGLLVAGNVFCMACPVHAAPDARPALAAARLELAAAAAEQVVGRPAACALPVGVRGVRPLGQPVVDGVDRARLLRRRRSSIDGLFRGAAFCKYVCPIGQFNFVQSLVSPLEVKVRDPAVLRSRAGPRTASAAATASPAASCTCSCRAKAGNMDCTFCLDCVHACPHDNIGISRGCARGERSWPIRTGRRWAAYPTGSTSRHSCSC